MLLCPAVFAQRAAELPVPLSTARGAGAGLAEIPGVDGPMVPRGSSAGIPWKLRTILEIIKKNK